MISIKSMEMISKKWQIIFLGALLTSAVFFVASVFITPKYESKVSILVVPQIDSLDNDVSQNARYLGRVLLDSMYSSSFIGSIDGFSSKINDDPQKALREWKSQVKASLDKNSAIISIDVFDSSRTGAHDLSEEIAKKIIDSSSKYIGPTDKIKLEIISGPISFPKPVRPNMALNSMLGFVCGLAFMYLLFQVFDFELHIKDEPEKGIREEKTSFGDRLKREFAEFGGDVYPIGKMMRKTKKDLADLPEKTKELPKQEIPKKEILEPVESVRKIEPNGKSELQAPYKKIEPFIGREQKNLPTNLPESSATGLDKLPFAEVEDELPWKSRDFAEIEEIKEPVIEKKAETKQKKEDFVPLEELEEKPKEDAQAQEPTEEEIKDRLNKLLRGEL